MAIYGGPDIVTSGLVFDMDFGNSKCYPGTGSNCYDLSSNRFTGELINSPPYSTSINNKYFTFNGTTNTRVIRIPNSTVLDTQTPSVEVWIKTNATTQSGFWFEKGNVNTQYSLFQEGANIQWRQYFTSISTFSTNAVNAGLNTTSWFQVVGTYSSGSRKLYINGVLKNSDAQTGTINTNSGGMSIGAYGGYNGSRGYYYNGDIAIVRVYNKQLSDNEVLNNYNALKGRFGL
jgi:hypothetical protein